MNFPIILLSVFAISFSQVLSQEETRTAQDICGRANPQNEFRVLRGQEAAECEFPWMVIVSARPQRGENKSCAGSIIDESHVLTTATCVSHRNSNQPYSTSELTVYSGTSNANNPERKENKVERITSHSGFSTRYLVNDIAVIKLQEPIKFDRCQRPICLFQEDEYRRVQDLQTCRVMGWGSVSNRNTRHSENLMWTPQRAATPSLCLRTYRRRQGTFCASGTSNNGICRGDTGAPLTCQHADGRYHHYGIASLIISGHCGSRFSLYTSVYDFLQWIRAAQAPAWNEWKGWSSCDGACTQTRTRTCNTGNISDCEGDSEESRNCTGNSCPAPRTDEDVCGRANTQNTFRVIGGQRAAECEFPWMVVVSVRGRGGIHSFCGGSIIDSRHILTAAHCVAPRNSNRIYPTSLVTVYSGTSNVASRQRKRNAVDKITAHRGYIPRSLVNDLAVIRLRQSIKFDDCQRPICLFQDNEYIQVQSLQSCRVIGWGKTQNGNSPVSRDLMWAAQMVFTPAQCGRIYRRRPGTFCAGGQNGAARRSSSCNGDSGGPFTCQHSNGRYFQYGIVSAGVPNQCGIRPSLYSDVNYFRKWIYQAMAQD